MKKHLTSLKWKLCKYLMFFAFFTLATIFLFQIVLLEPMYEKSKISAIRQVEQTGEMGLKTDDFDDFINTMQTQSDTCIFVYRDSGSTFAESRGSTGCVLSSLSAKKLTSYIQKASASSDNSYLAKLSMVPVSVDGPDEASIFRTIVYTKIVDTDTTPAAIMVAGSITPLDATISTLTNQLYFVMFFLIIAVVLLTVLLYRKIADPLIAISQHAKSLDKGEYTAIGAKSTYTEVSELDGTLSKAAENIRKADKAKRDLISNVSHDLRTPLTMIGGYGEMMIDLPEEKTDENLQVIVDESKRLNNLVNDLLDLSRLQENRIVLKKENFDLSSFISEQMKKYEVYRVQENFVFEVHLCDSVNVYADRIRIAQVFNNFMINGINYGGNAKHMIVRTEQIDPDHVRISVQDFGEGIDEKDLDNIWERYYKIDKEHVRSSSGSGIGLAICRQLLELHQVKYGVISKKKEGSTFWFELPVSKKQESTENNEKEIKQNG